MARVLSEWRDGKSCHFSARSTLQSVQRETLTTRQSRRRFERCDEALPSHLPSVMPQTTAEALNDRTSTIITCAIKIHRALGPGLVESAYCACLCHDLVKAGLQVERQKPIALVYGGLTIDCAYRADIVVENCVIVEVKALDALAPIHRQQLYTYLRLGNYRVGLLLNFGASTLRDGIQRVVNNFPDR